MKNKILLFIFSIFLSGAVVGQSGTYAKQTTVADPGFGSALEATKLASQIVQVAGMKQNFVVREAQVPNAAAVIANGRRYILYNRGFINKLTQVTGTRWAAVSVLAHEIGHHLANQAGSTVRLASELQADEFSGYVLRKMGATLSESQAAMQALGNVKGSATHPPRQYRLNAIENGWDNAEPSSKEVLAKNNSRTNSQVRTTASTSSVIATIDFNSDPSADYYVTSKYNVVKVSNNKMYSVGKLAKLDSNQFPYLIYDGDNNKVYVSSSGKILNANGNTVGKLTVVRS
jgi:hypothetical protein